MRRAKGCPPALVALAALLAAAGLPAAVPAHAEGFRNITALTLDTYYDGSAHLNSVDVLLARIVPGFTLEAKIARDDAPGWYQHTATLGPVVNVTDQLYLEAIYGLGLDSADVIVHNLEANLTLEGPGGMVTGGVRGSYFPGTGYFYVLPSLGAKFFPVRPLGVFGKVFWSIDSAGVLTGAFWGETDYQLTPAFSGRAGFTLSYAGALGYSVIAGFSFSFSDSVAIRYTFQYLSGVVTYIAQPQTNNGVENALTVDVRF